MKTSIIGLILLIFGFTAGYLVQINKKVIYEPVEAATSQNQINEGIKKKFLRLSQNEIKDYVNESDPMLKGEKADYILSELLKLFLVDIGLKIADLNSNFNKTRLDYAQYKKNSGSNIEQKPLLPMNCQYSRDICMQKYGAFKQEQQELNWRRKEFDLNQVATVNNTNKFLDKVQVKDMAPFITASKTINRAYVKLFEGEFSGQLTIEKPQPQTLDVEMSIADVKYKNGTPTADLKIVVYDDGKRTSSNASNGVLKAITTFADRSQGFILHISPSKKIQIYSMADNKTLFGNVYQKFAKKSEFEFIGRAVLSRD